MRPCFRCKNPVFCVVLFPVSGVGLWCELLFSKLYKPSFMKEDLMNPVSKLESFHIRNRTHKSFFYEIRLIKSPK